MNLEAHIWSYNGEDSQEVLGRFLASIEVCLNVARPEMHDSVQKGQKELHAGVVDGDLKTIMVIAKIDLIKDNFFPMIQKSVVYPTTDLK